MFAEEGTLPMFHRMGMSAWLLIWWAGPAAAQRLDGGGPESAYKVAIAQHFRVSLAEVEVLSSWVGGLEHVPVLLVLSSRAGVAPDVLGALRQRGAGWDALARRFNVDPSSFVVPLGEGMVPRGLERVYAGPPTPGLSLEDSELVALVNLKMFSSLLEVSAARVAGGRTWGGSYPALLSALRQGLPPP